MYFTGTNQKQYIHVITIYNHCSDWLSIYSIMTHHSQQLHTMFIFQIFGTTSLKVTQ